MAEKTRRPSTHHGKKFLDRERNETYKTETNVSLTVSQSWSVISRP